MNKIDLREAWETYKRSPAWQKLKRERMVIAHNKCEELENSAMGIKRGYTCQHTEDLELHHDIYPAYPFDENDSVDNVRIMCRDCHQEFHDQEYDNSPEGLFYAAMNNPAYD